MDATERVIDVVLWGTTQSGKSTALAAYLWNYEPDWVDKEADETRDARVKLSGIWQALKQNRLISGTALASSYTVRHRRGHLVKFRDMRGGNAGDLGNNPQDFEALQSAQAVIPFLEWPSRLAVENRLALDTVLRIARKNCHIAIALTKAECGLNATDFALLAMDRNGNQNLLDQVESDTVDALDYVKQLYQTGHPVFPVSVYGYDKEGNPAHYRDEFGRLVPRNIRPMNVDSPFDWVLRPLFE